jgi:pteridine reductase
VTGAARRLGREIAARLAAAGARVMLHARRDGSALRAAAAAIRADGGQAEVGWADLADEGEVARLVTRADRDTGGLRLVVNNAGAYEHSPLETLDCAAFDRLMSANARTAFLVTLHAGRRMAGAGGGSIVNLACPSGLKAWGGHVPYSASKAAVVSLTQGFARALAPRVRVNAVAPGPVLIPEGWDAAGVERVARTTLLGRWGGPADVCEAVLFLATQPWLTGVVLPVDGGRSAR